MTVGVDLGPKGHTILLRALSSYPRDRERVLGFPHENRTAITAQAVADTVETARYLFFNHMQDVRPRYICYGNNAAPLAQAGAMLEDTSGRQAEIYTIPSAGYSVEQCFNYAYEHHISQEKHLNAYRELLTAVHASPDEIVNAPEDRPVIFIRPFGVTAQAFEALSDFMRSWVSECAKEHFPDSPEKQKEYRDSFYRKSGLIALQSEQWYGRPTKVMPINRWHGSRRVTEMRIPESTARSLRALRAVTWMPTFAPEGVTSSSRSLYSSNNQFKEQTSIILQAMAEYIAHGTEVDWQAFAKQMQQRPDVTIEPPLKTRRIVDQYRRGVAHRSENYLELLNRRGHETEDAQYQRG